MIRRGRFLPALAALAVLLFLGTGRVLADSAQLRIGAQYQAWSMDSLSTYSGWEIWTPVSFTYFMGEDLRFFLLGKFGTGEYTDSVGLTKTVNMTDFSDTILGGVGHFTHFGVPALVDLRVNIPTGDSTWEGNQIYASIPTEFIGSRYQGRGLGVSAFYGLSFPSGDSSVGTGVGYLYTEAFVTDEVLVSLTEGLKLGDAVFVVLNRLENFKDKKSSRMRLSGTYFLPTYEAGVEIFQMGPNVNLSYAFQDPTGFSYEVGAQIFTPARRLNSLGEVDTEPKNSFGQRFYFLPSLKLPGEWAVAGRVKYILPNGYQDPDALYNGGGFLLGLEPSYRFELGGKSSLRVSASYDWILHKDGGQDGSGNRLDAMYGRWVFGTEYQVGF